MEQCVSASQSRACTDKSILVCSLGIQPFSFPKWQPCQYWLKTFLRSPNCSGNIFIMYLVLSYWRNFSQRCPIWTLRKLYCCSTYTLYSEHILLMSLVLKHSVVWAFFHTHLVFTSHLSSHFKSSGASLLSSMSQMIGLWYDIGKMRLFLRWYAIDSMPSHRAIFSVCVSTFFYMKKEKMVLHFIYSYIQLFINSYILTLPVRSLTRIFWLIP